MLHSSMAYWNRLEVQHTAPKIIMTLYKLDFIPPNIFNLMLPLAMQCLVDATHFMPPTVHVMLIVFLFPGLSSYLSKHTSVRRSVGLYLIILLSHRDAVCQEFNFI